MRSVAASFVIVSFALLAGAATASVSASSFRGGVALSIKGWGVVKPGSGFDLHRKVPCRNASCSGEALFARLRHVVLTANPYQGWKFFRWHGPCKTKTKPRCAINLGRMPRDTIGERVARVRATFIPVAPGLTRANPVPIGTAASIGRFISVKVNSATPNLRLSPPAPAGAEYFDANLTVTYTGTGSVTAGGLTYHVSGSSHTPYGPFTNPCPDPGPQPPLDYSAPLQSGQSTTGYVCWAIASSAESSVELYFGPGTFNFPGTTWLALH
jgi:hypothetical protein